MTTISNTADLLRLLRENPDFRDEVRRLLLSQELIELPERFARFEAYVERQFTEVQSDIARVDGDITEMRSNIIHIRGEVTEIRGEVVGTPNLAGGEVAELKGRPWSTNAESGACLRVTQAALSDSATIALFVAIGCWWAQARSQRRNTKTY